MIRSFIKSFKHAFQGLYVVARREASFRIQLFAALVVIIFLFIIPFATWERILLILMASAVLVLEVLNSIIERISDALKPRLHPVVKEVKDMMAGAVLLTAITSVIVATLIFSSYVGVMLER